MIKYIKGDIIKAFDVGDMDILLHQCNCVTGTKVSGFAKVLQDKYPQVNTVLNKNHSESFGEVWYSYIDSERCIANMFSQYYPSSPSNGTLLLPSGFEIEDSFYNRCTALKDCLEFIKEDYIGHIDTRVAMPLVASGLAKDKIKEYDSDLDYFTRYIAPIVDEVFKDYKINVYYL